MIDDIYIVWVLVFIISSTWIYMELKWKKECKVETRELEVGFDYPDNAGYFKYYDRFGRTIFYKK